MSKKILAAMLAMVMILLAGCNTPAPAPTPEVKTGITDDMALFQRCPTRSS